MKNIKYFYSKFFFLLALIVVTTISCERDLADDATIATFSKSGEVYFDGFSAGLEYLPFGGSVLDAFSVDEETKYRGSSSMRFDVPNVGDPSGSYAGAIFPDYGGRDLSDFDALTFWAKGTQARALNEVGFGQDFGENKYLVVQNNLLLSTNWRKYTIAIPDASKLIRESGLFWYAEGPENETGFTFWVDDLQFETLGTIGQSRPSIAGGIDVTSTTFLGTETPISPLQHTVNLASGTDQTITIAPSYFEFSSSNPSAITVNELGVMAAVGMGTSVITATLNGIEAAGSITVTVLGNFTNAPVPTQNAADVISIFSDAYVNIPVDYYNGYWAPYQTTLGQDDLNINGDNIISYSNLNFVGIQFAVDAPTVNATEMTHFHVDVQALNPVGPGDFLIVRIADIGADNAFGGGDDSSAEIRLTNADLVSNSWFSVDVPLTELPSLTSRANLAQIVFVSDATITDAYVDNVYFYKGSGVGPTGPTTAAPTPTRDAASVISVFSEAYTDIDGTDFNPDWGQATATSQVDVAGNNTLLYAGLNYQGTQFGSSQDVSGMDFLHIDYWTDNSTALNAFLISSAPEEAAKILSVPTSGWASVDIPLSDFSPVDLADVIQMKFDGNGDIYLDNIYFYTESASPTEPTEAAPTPTRDAGNVISVFSDAYTNLADTDFNPDWGQATAVSQLDIAGNNTLLYAGLNYQGTMFSSSQDVSGMDFLHIDYWTANSSGLNTFLISNGPVETGKSLAVPTAGWGSIDIPLGDFSPVDLADVIQMKFDGDGDIYLDNIYFYSDGGVGPTEPTEAAPAPTADAGNVISVFSDTYTNIGGTNLNPDWGQATVVTEMDIAGNNTMLYAGLNYQGIELGSAQDVSGMDFLHIDYWTANSTALNTFLISGDATETAKILSVPTSGWASMDIPLGEFSPVDLADVIQLKFDGDGDIYLDNIYFYSDEGIGPMDEFTINGDFETGDLSGWTLFTTENNGTFEITSAQANGGTYSGLLVADVDAAGGAASFPVIKQANLGVGTITPNTEVTISFDLFGSVAGAGGVVFAEFFSELNGGGVSMSEILGGGPLFPNGTWTTHTFNTTTGSDVSGGITLQLKADCGGNPGCKIEAYFDNVSVTLRN